LVYLFTFSVEDPSEDFVRLRDFVDVSNGLKLVSAFADPEIVKGGFSEDMVKVNRYIWVFVWKFLIRFRDISVSSLIQGYLTRNDWFLTGTLRF
jgi:hypothetical protein